MKNLIRILSAGAMTVLLPMLSQAADEPAGTFVKPAPAISAEEKKYHLGVLGGVMDTTDGAGGYGEYGLDIGFQPYIPFGAGLAILRAETSELNRTTALFRGTYNFGGSQAFVSHSYLGYAIGAVRDEATDIDGTFLASGPVAGFDFPLRAMQTGRKTASLGAQAQYLFTEGSSPDALSVNAQLKFWF